MTDLHNDKKTNINYKYIYKDVCNSSNRLLVRPVLIVCLIVCRVHFRCSNIDLLIIIQLVYYEVYILLTLKTTEIFSLTLLI